MPLNKLTALLSPPPVRYAIVAVLLGIALFHGSGNPFFAHNLILIFLYMGLAQAWNIIGGYAGQLSLGHVAFFGIGAYGSTLLHMNYNITPWAGVLVGAALAAAVAYGLGWACLRLKGAYFTLATIAFAEVMRILATNLPAITKGAVGIGIPFRPGFTNMIFQGKMGYVLLSLGFAIVVWLVCRYIDKNRLGYYLASIREDETTSASMGINVANNKVLAMVLSAIFTAVGGTVYSQYILFVEPTSEFAYSWSLNMALLAIFGGMGTLYGPILGALILVPVQETLRVTLGGSFQGLHLVVYGLVLVLTVLFMPKGLYATLAGFVKTGLRKMHPAVGGEGS
jgi:branched-chain amino acid transport system permease protein